MTSARNKIKSLDEIARITQRAKASGKKVVTTNGAFDLIHVGHIHNLEEAKSLGDLLIVGINSDRSVKNYKGPTRPIIDENDRAEIVAALQAVDYVFIFDDPDPRPWLQKIRPNIHVKGADRTLRQIVERDVLKKIGAELVFAPIVKGKSTTGLINKLRKASV